MTDDSTSITTSSNEVLEHELTTLAAQIAAATCRFLLRTFLDGHHVQHWEHGGPTELRNLVHLCWHHHHLVHEGGWRLEHDDRGGVRYYRPDGTELRHAIPAMATEPLVADVATDALLPLWAGETFDLSACVDATMQILSPTK
jgi:hypothetical protein